MYLFKFLLKYYLKKCMFPQTIQHRILINLRSKSKGQFTEFIQSAQGLRRQLELFIGNVIGGVALVAAINHAQVVSGKGGGKI